VFPIRSTVDLDDDRTRIVPIATSGSLSHDESGPGAEIAALAGGVPARCRGTWRVSA
jgi:leucyl aminopeptidase